MYLFNIWVTFYRTLKISYLYKLYVLEIFPPSLWFVLSLSEDNFEKHNLKHFDKVQLSSFFTLKLAFYPYSKIFAYLQNQEAISFKRSFIV